MLVTTLMSQRRPPLPLPLLALVLPPCPCLQAGNLRPYLSAYFDTSSGPKQEAKSYKEIALSLGLDPALDTILFATDVLGEAEAAKAAGWQAVLVSRPGNKALPDGHGFRVISSMQDLL